MISAYEVLKLHLLTEFPRQTLKCDNKRKVGWCFLQDLFRFVEIVTVYSRAV